MTTAVPEPVPDVRQRPRLLVFVVVAWVVAAGLTFGGLFTPLFVETESHSSSDSSDSSSSTSDSDDEESDESSFEITAFDQTVISRGKERPQETSPPVFGLPIGIGVGVLVAGGLIGIGALATRSEPGMRWATGVAGTGSVFVLGAAGVTGMVVKSIDDQITALTSISSSRSIEANIGSGMWMLLLGASLGVLATLASMIARSRGGPELLHPADEDEPQDAPQNPDEGPATPSFGVPVIRPIGYD